MNHPFPHKIKRFWPPFSHKKKWQFKWSWRTVLRCLIAGIGAFVVLSILLFAWYYRDLPKPGELRSRTASESTILYDQKDRPIFDIAGDENRILLTSQEIPEVMKQAAVSIEDKNFYQHHGVDFRGIVRGVIVRPLTGRSPQGGSTITQQYIKNAILSPERSPIRKIKEIILALELEAIYSKDQILTLYLNEIPFGSNAYGIEAATQAYFGKSLKDKDATLTLPEAATLAAIIQAPTRYSPYGSHVDLLMRRKSLVLDDMAAHGYITQAQADDAKKQAPLAEKDFAQKRQNFPAPHFAMYVREQLAQKYGEDLIQRGGLRVKTSLDLDVQSIADSAVKDQVGTLTKAKASNAGLVAIDPKNGNILAMVGSVDYFDREHEGNFNITTSPNRQPGSAGKPLVYATLFEDKWSPSSVLWDVQTDFNGYKPGNFDGKFHGPVTIRTALGNSFNIPAVKALQLEGIPNFLDTARNLGITTLDDQKDAGLSLALGGGAVKLVDLTSAYSVFANGGERNPMVSILKIQDSRGKTIYEYKPQPKQVIKPEIAYEISHILSDVNAKQPTFGRLINVLSVSGKTTAVKTGTSNDFKDAWTIGYTPSVVAGVWAGNNDGAEMDHGGGSTVAAPIWHAFMVKMLANKSNEPFTRPETIQDMTVDLLSGKKPTPASGQLVQDIFAPWQVPTGDDDVHKQVKVCKSNGFLASDAAPPEEIEVRTYSSVHSEHPDNPAWEGPVQAFAKQAGLISGEPPTQKCDITFTNPTVKITTPENGAAVSGLFTTSADVNFPPNITGSVDFAVDGHADSTDTTAPYSASIDSSSLAPGSHQITATAHGTNGGTGSDTITITVTSPVATASPSVDTSPPGEVNNVALVPLTGGRARATWTNPADSDLASVSFYASLSAGVKGSKVGTIPASANSNQTTTITGLTSGVTNYITFVTTDTHSNNNPTTKQYTVIPL